MNMRDEKIYKREREKGGQRREDSKERVRGDRCRNWNKNRKRAGIL